MSHAARRRSVAIRESHEMNDNTFHLDESKWGSKRRSVSSMSLPPTVGPLPVVNETMFLSRNSSSGTLARPRSALGASRRRSSAAARDAACVYLINPQAEDAATREQKRRMLKALLRYDAPESHLQKERSTTKLPDEGSFSFQGDGHASSNTSDDGWCGAEAEELVPELNVEMGSVEASIRGGSARASPRMSIASPRGSISTTAMASPRKSMMAVPSLSLPTKTPRGGGQSTSRATQQHDAEQRRKSLKALLVTPNDVLSSIGAIEDTLQALGDDEKLLGLEEQLLSARPTHRHLPPHRSPMASHVNTPRLAQVHLPPLPEVVAPDFTLEIAEALKFFSPLETLREMLTTVSDIVTTISVDLVEQVHEQLGAHVRKQQGVLRKGLEAVCKLMDDVILPSASEQVSMLEALREELKGERHAVARAKADTSKIQASIRQYGIVPAVWGIIPPNSDHCAVLCCDFPLALHLWEKDAPAMRQAMRLVVELERRLIREMRSAYEAYNDGVSCLLCFSSAKAALDWALAFQNHLLGLSWPDALLALPLCAPDARLLWKGLTARMTIHSGSLCTRVDPISQITSYFGEVYRVASEMMCLCPLGTIVASSNAMDDVPNLKDLATHGGAFGVPFSAEVLGCSRSMVRLVPLSLKGRLERYVEGSTSAENVKGVYPNFLMHTPRPHDYLVGETLALKFMGKERPKSGETNSGEARPQADDGQICVSHEFWLTSEEEEEELKQLRMCVECDFLTPSVCKLLTSAEQSGISVVTMFVQLVDAHKAFEKSRSSFLPTIRTLLTCVKRAVKGLTSGTDVSCVGETVSLVFASRTEGLQFVERFVQFFAHASWPDETREGWRLAFPDQVDPVPEVVIGVDYGPIKVTTSGLDVNATIGNLATDYTVAFAHHHELAFDRYHAPDQFLSGFARMFDTACALAQLALPSEILVSAAVMESGGNRPLNLAELGHFSIKSPKFEGLVFSASAEALSRGGKRGAGASVTVHSSVAAEGAFWPASYAMRALREWLPSVSEMCQQNQRAMMSLLAERSINQMRRAPQAREVFFVCVEAHVPRDMWSNRQKHSILEALRSYQRCVRGLLTEIEDGYEVFTDAQVFFLAFQSRVKAAQFGIDIQDKLASLFWPPSFLEAFPAARRITADDGTLLWNGLKVRAAVVTPPGESENPEVGVDTISSTGVTAYFGRGVGWTTSLCAAASYGQTLLDQRTVDALQSHFSSLGDPIIEPAGTVLFPGKRSPVKVFSVRSRLIKHRFLPPNSDGSLVFHPSSSLFAWMVTFTAEDNPVTYVMNNTINQNSTRRPSMLLGSGLTTPFAQHGSALGTSLMPPGLFELMPSPDPCQRAASPNPMDEVAAASMSRSVTILPTTLTIPETPRIRKDLATPTRGEPSEQDVDELVGELNRCHKLVRRVLEQEQLYVRTQIFRESNRAFKSEEEFLKSIVTICRDLGVHWKGEKGQTEKAFTSLSGAVVPIEAVVGKAGPSSAASGQVSRASSGIPLSARGPPPAQPTNVVSVSEIGASVAAALCQFHTFLSRSARTHNKRHGSEAGLNRPRKSITSEAESSITGNARRGSMAGAQGLLTPQIGGMTPRLGQMVFRESGAFSSNPHELGAKDVFSDEDASADEAEAA